MENGSLDYMKEQRNGRRTFKLNCSFGIKNVLLMGVFTFLIRMV